MNRNARTLTVLLGVAGGMLGLAFASVPLYNLFCRVTGYGGTPQLAEGGLAPGAVAKSPEFTVFFNTDVNMALPWSFRPLQRSVRVKAGQESLIAFEATNKGDHDIEGTAVFNVTPEIVAPYFVKVQCFCFEKQTLHAGQTMNFPVMFYLDPTILDDPAMPDMREVTLSYTFFRSGEETLEPKPAAVYQLKQNSGG